MLVRRSGEFAGAEDAVQEALLAAAQHWPAEGVPDNPRGWLIQVGVAPADRSDTQRAARGTAGGRRGVPGAASSRTQLEQPTTPCCCSSCAAIRTLTPASAIALTLRAVGGLTTAEIASAFLVPEATMAQRISRAKQRIKVAARRFAMPTRAGVADRLRSVLQVLYLIFNEGYARSGGPGVSPGRAFRPRPSGSPACCTHCFPPTARSPGCWR